MSVPRIVCVTLGSLWVIGFAHGELRTFTDRQGRTIQAEKVSASANAVVLRLANGQTVSVPLTQLSDADRTYLAGSEAEPHGGSASSSIESGSPVTWDYDANPKGNSDLATAKFRVWIPDAARPVRGMIVLVPGSNGDGRGSAGDGGWQALASELGFGLIGCNFASGNAGAGYCYAAKGSGKTLLEALEHFAAEKNRPEIAKAPLLLWGHSAGGQFNYNFACWKPERTIAFIVNEGGFFYDTTASPQTRATPAIIFAGAKDTPERVGNLTKLFESGRSRGALWAFCLEKDLGHAVGPSQDIARQFFRSMVTLRLPASAASSDMKRLALADGLLAPRGGDAVPAAQFHGSAREASWLPDQATAEKWKAAQ